MPGRVPDPVRSRAGGGTARLSDQAYLTIKERLVDGLYEPGSRLSADDFVTSLGIGRQPVMDALKRIAGDGLIEIIPQVGCRVVAPSLDEVLDYFRLFAAAEGLCAELAAQRAKPAELRALERVSAQIAALSADDPDRLATSHDYRVLNRDFHGLVHHMAASPTLAAIAAGLWDRSDFYIATAKRTVLFAERLEEAHAEHEAVRQAIAEGEAERAKGLMEDHVLGFARAIRAAREA